jgi:hypothetical protein
MNFPNDNLCQYCYALISHRVVRVGIKFVSIPKLSYESILPDTLQIVYKQERNLNVEWKLANATVYKNNDTDAEGVEGVVI